MTSQINTLYRYSCAEIPAIIWNSGSSEFFLGEIVQFRKTGKVGKIINLRENEVRIEYLDGQKAWINSVYLDKSTALEVARSKL